MRFKSRAPRGGCARPPCRHDASPARLTQRLHLYDVHLNHDDAQEQTDLAAVLAALPHRAIIPVVLTIEVRRLASLGEPQIAGLAEVLNDCVQGGASVSFMLPMSLQKAAHYWRSMAGAVTRGEAIVLAAFESTAIVGTVTLLLRQPENQPHRADIAKMLVHRRARRRGAGALLLAAAEDEARRGGKTLLVLDTASAAAGRVYVRGGWHRVGEIPDYALWPGGGLCPTTVFYKRL